MLTKTRIIDFSSIKWSKSLIVNLLTLLSVRSAACRVPLDNLSSNKEKGSEEDADNEIHLILIPDTMN